MSRTQTIYLGADHAGFASKEILKKILKKPLRVVDLSPALVHGDDYPPIARKVALLMQRNPGSLGMLICGTGHGMEMAANRFRGIRAIVARTEADAMLGREHNHANVLVLGGWITKPAHAKKILAHFLAAEPSKATRHLRRVKQIEKIK